MRFPSIGLPFITFMYAPYWYLFIVVVGIPRRIVVCYEQYEFLQSIYL